MNANRELVRILSSESIELIDTLPIASQMLAQAADTIEALSAKLAAANMERSDRHYGSGWIACEDRLPENNRDVLISVRCKLDGELDIAISSWADARFGGHSLGYKEWSKPWDYFHANYDVIAWRELPQPYNQ